MAPEEGMLRISPATAIPLAAVRFTFDPAGGPGGQHVNKTSTRVAAHLDVAGCPGLTEAQRARIRRALASRISAEGVLRVVCGAHRSQAQNRAEALERLRVLLATALAPRKRRRKTRPTAASRERRLETKKRRSAAKRLRRTAAPEE